jgi:CBS domain containing-hemolysin-like protein
MPLDQVIEVLNRHEYTRYPVIANGDAARFIGFINTKEMLTSVAAGRTFSMDAYIHDMPGFSEKSPIKDVLIQMQQSRVHMAIVNNDEGAAIGLVTMEDILEEIVGDIKDEYEHKDLVNPPKRLKLT